MPPSTSLKISSRTNNPEADQEDSPFGNVVKNKVLLLASLFAFAIAIRAAVSLHPYSGERTPPMFGDFEAQRHWMEITLNLPPSQWYVSSSNNNLTYWGLDYPPLSAYLSQVFGHYLSFIDPRSVALNTSHGFETSATRSAMRKTVLLCDALLVFPSLYMLTDGQPSNTLIFALSSPALLLIDHAHFQYNNVSAALLLFCIVMLQRRHDALAAAFYTLCVLFKQTNMYYGPVIACVLLSRLVSILVLQRRVRKAVTYAMNVVIAILCVLIFTFAPLVIERTNGTISLNKNFTNVLNRIFPLSRGLFEDKVANVWCTLSTTLPRRLRPVNLMTERQLLSACAIMTVATSAPFCISVAFRPWCMKRLILGLSGTALSAFLWSYQVHEKQILVSLVPLALLHDELPLFTTWVSTIGAMSVLPLLLKEGSVGAYVACIGVHAVVGLLSCLQGKVKVRDVGVIGRVFAIGWLVLYLGLHVALMWLNPPRRLPDLFIVAVIGFCCAQLCLAYVVLIYKTVFI